MFNKDSRRSDKSLRFGKHGRKAFAATQSTEPNKTNKQGLVVDFEPDFSIMKQITITCEDVLRLAANIVPLTRHGDTVEFTGYKANGKVIHENLVNTDGIMEYLIKKNSRSKAVLS